ncbi:helix-turn-helix domain-containing protein [Oceaniglobus trochenteri]|uniref:helix-turn-helix domain-containing protein n=1 Tax=Oceaniglobus trochenteri TaxID=2763260 RepID=UPI001CFFEFC5
MAAPVYTAEMLADRWGCSAETVRQMVRERRLPAFRVGRMMRITSQAVEAYECGTTGSEGSRADLSSCGTRPEPGGAIVLRHTRSKRQSAKPAT